MALHGTLILNGADYAPFNLYGVGVFMAHSGQGTYRNNASCAAIPAQGHCHQANTGSLSVGTAASPPR